MTDTDTTSNDRGRVSIDLIRQRPGRVAVVGQANRETVGSIAVSLDGADLYLTEAGARRLLASLTVTLALLDSERDAPASEPTAVAS